MTKAKMPVDIRTLNASDREAWQGLWTAYLKFYGTSVSDDVFDVTFARLLGDDPRDFNCFIADVDGTPVGLTHYLFHRHNWRIEDVVYLQDLYADPDARGMGVGRALIEAVYAAANAKGSHVVHWMTQEANATARQLYDRIASKTEFVQYTRPA